MAAPIIFATTRAAMCGLRSGGNAVAPQTGTCPASMGRRRAVYAAARMRARLCAAARLGNAAGPPPRVARARPAPVRTAVAVRAVRLACRGEHSPSGAAGFLCLPSESFWQPLRYWRTGLTAHLARRLHSTRVPCRRLIRILPAPRSAPRATPHLVTARADGGKRSGVRRR